MIPFRAAVHLALLLAALPSDAAGPPSAPDALPPAAFTAVAPEIDGSPSDECWLLAKEASFNVPGRSGGSVAVRVRTLHSSESVFVLAQWKCTFESRSQSPWIWDPGLQIYRPGDEKEDCLSLYWIDLGSRGPVDLWVWRAERTDPAGCADDLFGYVRPSSLKAGAPASLELRFDSGLLCWHPSRQGVFSGERLPRFLLRTPSGSAADVKAKGIWADGVWTVEFERRKSTGNPDDIEFKDGVELIFAPSLEAPGTGRRLDETPAARFRLSPSPQGPRPKPSGGDAK